MWVSAWYEDGRLILPEGISLKSQKMKVTIDIPDNEIKEVQKKNDGRVIQKAVTSEEEDDLMRQHEQRDTQ